MFRTIERIDVHARVQIFIRNVKFENGSGTSEVVSQLNVRYIIYYVEVRSRRKARRRFAKEKVYHLYDLVYLESPFTRITIHIRWPRKICRISILDSIYRAISRSHLPLIPFGLSLTLRCPFSIDRAHVSEYLHVRTYLRTSGNDVPSRSWQRSWNPKREGKRVPLPRIDGFVKVIASNSPT